MSELVLLVVAAVVALVAVRRTRAEPRRLGNAFWLLAAVALVVQAAVAVGLPGGGLAVLATGGVLLLSPVLVLVLVVLLLANGVTMLRRESRSTGNLLSLLAGLGLLALLLSPLLVLVTGLHRWVLAGVLLLGLLAAYLGFVLLAFLAYSWLYPRLVRRYPAEWVAVLGSGLGRDSRVTPLLAARIRTGLETARRHGARRLVLSGGQGADEELAEAEAMERWLEQQQVLPAGGPGEPELVLETASSTTEQNLRNTAVVLGAGDTPETLPPGLVVTSSYHVLRTALLARKLGLPAQVAGAPVARYFWPSAVLREYVAVLAEHRMAHAVLAAVVALPIPLALVVVPHLGGV